MKKIQVEEELIDMDMLKNPLAPYRYPPNSLLTAPPSSQKNLSDKTEEELKSNAERLIAALKSFGIGATVTSVTQGSSVTRYEIEPDIGTKLTSITSLTDDIALSLGVASVRIAPVPGKANMVGIGVPREFSTLYIRDLIDSSEFASANESATVIIGRGVDSQNIVANLANLSHLLVAGSDNSGKTVFLDAIITSILYKASPEQLRFLMIDAKMIDLNIFNGIPHLLCPVVTGEKQAIKALEWVAAEIDRRYNLLGQCGIDSYNEKIADKPDGELMPRIIVIVDHIAMLTGIHNEIEGVVARIAKKASMCGVHLILSTQQPEAEVIKGIIEAINPSRIAFRIAWKKGSQAILGTDEAKKLAGRGDMLYLPVGAEAPLRVQGCYIDESDVNRVVSFLKEQNGKPPQPQSNIPGSASGEDPMLPAAIEAIIESGQGSTSYLQRRLKLGYARASRFMDKMEELGIVGPFDGSKPRAVLVTQDDWERMKRQV